MSGPWLVNVTVAGSAAACATTVTKDPRYCIVQCDLHEILVEWRLDSVGCATVINKYNCWHRVFFLYRWA